MFARNLKKGLLLPLAAVTLLITACGSKPPVPDPVGTLTVTPSALTLSDAAATEALSVTANCDWGVSVDQKDWCSVSPSGGVEGTSAVTVKVQENKAYEPRTATVTFRYDGKTVPVTVTQAGDRKSTL